MSPAKAFAFLAQQSVVQENIQSLQTKLKTNNIWIWTKGTIEEHLQLNAKTEREWTRFRTAVETDGIEATLEDDYAEVAACVVWLLE